MVLNLGADSVVPPVGQASCLMGRKDWPGPRAQHLLGCDHLLYTQTSSPSGRNQLPPKKQVLSHSHRSPKRDCHVLRSSETLVPPTPILNHEVQSNFLSIYVF